MKSNVKKLVDKLLPDIVDFTQQLVQTKSITEHEGDLARLVVKKMKELDYDGETVYAMCRQLQNLPDYVVICEPSGLDLSLGHKGRALLKVTSTGVSAHGSAPEKGVNAIYKMSPLLQRVEALDNTMQQQGDGTRQYCSD